MEAERMRVNNSQFLPGGEKFEQWMQEKFLDEREKLIPFGTHEESEPDLIPIVVHIVYKAGEPYGVGSNITNEQIYSQIEVLNEDFRRMNVDTIDTQAEFLPVASKLNIEFVLARQDENGQPTTGIVRVQGEKDSYNPLSITDRELLSSYSQWDPNIYLNIWVTDLTGQNIGLAQFPDWGESQGSNGLPGLDDKPYKDNASTDGLVIDYQAFGSAEKLPGLDLKPQYDQGRSATHEIGHFFGLLHVWGDITGIGGCSVDDFVDDTPISSDDYLGNCVPAVHESCGSNDMYENYMNYTDDACMNIFTTGQVGRMEIILQYAPRRASLLNSIGAEFPENIGFDLAITDVLSPGKALCEGDVIPSIKVRNNGGAPVGDFGILLTLNGNAYSYNYVGDSIQSGESVDLVFDVFNMENGVYHLDFELTNIPEDVGILNNKATHVFAVDDQQDFIPLREQFTEESINMTNWISINEDEDIGWEIVDLSYESSSNSAYINLYNYEDRTQVDWLVSPVLDFSNAVEASMTFRTSYARNVDFNDQLQIVISENCEGFFNTVLESYNSSDLAVENSGEFWEPNDRNDWKEHSLDLTDYAGKEDLRIAFKMLNDYGNNLYLDDIEFYTVANEKRVSSARNSFTLYPNPADGGRFQLAFNTNERQEVIVYIYDQLGREIVRNNYPNTLNQTYYFDFAGKRPGIYYIHAKGKNFIRSKKLLLTR